MARPTAPLSCLTCFLVLLLSKGTKLQRLELSLNGISPTAVTRHKQSAGSRKKETPQIKQEKPKQLSKKQQKAEERRKALELVQIAEDLKRKAEEAEDKAARRAEREEEERARAAAERAAEAAKLARVEAEKAEKRRAEQAAKEKEREKERERAKADKARADAIKARAELEAKRRAEIEAEKHERRVRAEAERERVKQEARLRREQKAEAERRKREMKAQEDSARREQERERQAALQRLERDAREASAIAERERQAALLISPVATPVGLQQHAEATHEWPSIGDSLRSRKDSVGHAAGPASRDGGSSSTNGGSVGSLEGIMRANQPRSPSSTRGGPSAAVGVPPSAPLQEQLSSLQIAPGSPHAPAMTDTIMQQEDEKNGKEEEEEEKKNEDKEGEEQQQQHHTCTSDALSGAVMAGVASIPVPASSVATFVGGISFEPLMEQQQLVSSVNVGAIGSGSGAPSTPTVHPVSRGPSVGLLPFEPAPAFDVGGSAVFVPAVLRSQQQHQQQLPHLVAAGSARDGASGVLWVPPAVHLGAPLTTNRGATHDTVDPWGLPSESTGEEHTRASASPPGWARLGSVKQQPFGWEDGVMAGAMQPGNLVHQAGHTWAPALDVPVQLLGPVSAGTPSSDPFHARGSAAASMAQADWVGPAGNWPRGQSSIPRTTTMAAASLGMETILSLSDAAPNGHGADRGGGGGGSGGGGWTNSGAASGTSLLWAEGAAISTTLGWGSSDEAMMRKGWDTIDAVGAAGSSGHSPWGMGPLIGPHGDERHSVEASRSMQRAGGDWRAQTPLGMPTSVGESTGGVGPRSGGPDWSTSNGNVGQAQWGAPTGAFAAASGVWSTAAQSLPTVNSVVVTPVSVSPWVDPNGNVGGGGAISTRSVSDGRTAPPGLTPPQGSWPTGGAGAAFDIATTQVSHGGGTWGSSAPIAVSSGPWAHASHVPVPTAAGLLPSHGVAGSSSGISQQPPPRTRVLTIQGFVQMSDARKVKAFVEGQFTVRGYNEVAPMGCALIELASEVEASQVKDMLTQVRMSGQQLKVEFASPDVVETFTTLKQQRIQPPLLQQPPMHIGVPTSQHMGAPPLRPELFRPGVFH